MQRGGDARQNVGAGKGRGVFNVIVAGHELGHDGDGVFLALGQLEGACQADDAGAARCELRSARFLGQTYPRTTMVAILTVDAGMNKSSPVKWEGSKDKGGLPVDLQHL